jgi:hypothetical protein
LADLSSSRYNAGQVWSSPAWCHVDVAGKKNTAASMRIVHSSNTWRYCLPEAAAAVQNHMHWPRDILQSQYPYIINLRVKTIRPLLDRRVNREQRRWPQESQSDTASQNSGAGRPGVGDLSATPGSDASFSMVEDEKHQFDAEVIEGVLQSKDPITKPIRIPRSSSPQSCPLCPNLENVSEFTPSQAKSGSGVKVWGNTSL